MGLHLENEVAVVKTPKIISNNPVYFAYIWNFPCPCHEGVYWERIHSSTHSEPWNYTTLHYTTLHYTTPHYTTLHYTTRPVRCNVEPQRPPEHIGNKIKLLASAGIRTPDFSVPSLVTVLSTILCVLAIFCSMLNPRPKF